MRNPDIAAPQFQRALGPLDATMIVIGSMIGSGIFIVSADIARTVGGGGYLLLVWLVTGVITILGALSYGELAGMLPHAGGQYVYLREAYNPLIGFLYGWTLFVVIQTGTIAAVAVAFAKFTSVLLPSLGEQTVLLAIGGFRVSAAQVVAILSIIVLTAANLRGIREGKVIQNIFTIAKTTALLGLIVLALAIGWNAEIVTANLATFWNAVRTQVTEGNILSLETLTGMGLLAAFGAAMVGSLFSSDAWNNITFTAAEVVNPQRTIPLSLFVGTLTVTLIYLLANVAYLAVLPVAGSAGATDVLGRGIQFAVNDRVGTAAATAIFGEGTAVVMALLIMVSTFGCNNGLILAGARVYYAMARDRLFFTSAGTLNNNGVPAGALIAQAIWACALCLSGTYGDLLDYVVFAVLIFYILTVAGVFILRRKRPDAPRPYKAFGYPVLPALYIAAAAAISLNLLVVKPAYTWPGLGLVVLGIPVYFAWARRRAA